MKSIQRKRRSQRTRRSNGGEGFDFVRCRICDDHRRVLSARHISKHGIERDEYMKEYGLSPDELIAKEFRIIQSSRRGYQPYGKRDWIAAIKKLHDQGGSVFAGDLQDKHAYLCSSCSGIESRKQQTSKVLGQEKNHRRATADAKTAFTALCDVRDEKPFKIISRSFGRIRVVE